MRSRLEKASTTTKTTEGDSDENSGEEESWRESPRFPRERLGDLEHNVDGNVGGVSGGNEDHVAGNRRKGDPRSALTRDRAGLDCVLVFAGRCDLSDEIGSLTEALSEQSVDGVAWLLLRVYLEMEIS